MSCECWCSQEILCQKNKSSISGKHEKVACAKTSVSVDWKPERAVQAKIRDMNKNDYPDRLKTWKGNLCRIEDHDKVTASVRHNPLGASSCQRTSDSKHLQIKDSEQRYSKLLGRITVILFNVPPHIFTIFQIFQRSVEPCPWQATTQFIKFESVPIYLELSFILFANFLLFFMAILKAKFFKIQNFFLHLLKSVNNKHALFELVSRWSKHQHSLRWRLHSGRETWLSTMERTSTLRKIQS